MYSVDVPPNVPMLRFETRALGRVFYAAPRMFTPRAVESGGHGHADYYEIFGVVDGRGEHDLLGVGCQPLATGHVVLIRPKDQHRFRGLAPAGMTVVNVAFTAAAWRTFADLTYLDRNGAWEHSQLPPVFTPQDAALDTMRAVFQRALTSSQPSPTMLDLVRFWTDLFELPGMRSDEDNSEDGGGPRRPAWLTQACAEMRREDNLHGGVVRLRELAHVSAAHLSRSMQETYGVTPTQFVADLRLQHAATLLSSTTASVTEIAYRCGFSSQSYFTRSFRVAHEVSPRAFRDRAVRAFLP